MPNTQKATVYKYTCHQHSLTPHMILKTFVKPLDDKSLDDINEQFGSENQKYLGL